MGFSVALSLAAFPLGQVGTGPTAADEPAIWGVRELHACALKPVERVYQCLCRSGGSSKGLSSQSRRRQTAELKSH